TIMAKNACLNWPIPQNPVKFTANAQCTFTDPRDGKIYPCIQIGTQVWMAKNLDAAIYNNGDPIPEVKDPTQWIGLKTGAWCYYENNTANGTIYGKLYNFYALKDPRGLAPAGWHIPSHTGWQVVENYLGGKNIAGGKMKETGTQNWNA